VIFFIYSRRERFFQKLGSQGKCKNVVCKRKFGEISKEMLPAYGAFQSLRYIKEYVNETSRIVTMFL
jgi:hypothetical protein